MAILKAEGRKFPTHTQVLVIGAGACGTIAALAAKEHGAEVVILERDAKPSGSTSLSSGQIPAAGTKLQRAAGLARRHAGPSLQGHPRQGARRMRSRHRAA